MILPHFGPYYPKRKMFFLSLYPSTEKSNNATPSYVDFMHSRLYFRNPTKPVMRRRIKRRKKRRIILFSLSFQTINFRMEYNSTLFSIPKILKFDFIFAFENFKIRLYFCFQILKNSTLFSLSNILKFDHIFAFEYFKIRLYFRFQKF
jgi:hypothetical protein